MLAKAYRLWKRQGGSTFDGGDDGDDGYSSYNGGDNGYYEGYGRSWWWTPAGMAVRYAIVALLFAFLLLFFVGGYYHARRRIRNGQPPLPYHRWMVRRYMHYPPQNAYGRQYPRNQGYHMENYPPPPPAYNSADMPPPVYQPPEGGSKAMADQSYVHVQPLPPTPGQQAGEGSERVAGGRL